MSRRDCDGKVLEIYSQVARSCGVRPRRIPKVSIATTILRYEKCKNVEVMPSCGHLHS
jgi:hypothetical protein